MKHRPLSELAARGAVLEAGLTTVAHASAPALNPLLSMVKRHRGRVAAAMVGIGLILPACVTSGNPVDLPDSGAENDGGLDGDVQLDGYFDANADAAKDGDAADAKVIPKDAPSDGKFTDAKGDAPVKDGAMADVNEAGSDSMEIDCIKELTIWTDGNQNSFVQGTSIGLYIDLPGLSGPSAVTALMKDKSGMGSTKVIKEFYDKKALAPATYMINWNGTDVGGVTVLPGNYTYSVIATNSICTVADERTVTVLPK